MRGSRGARVSEYLCRAARCRRAARPATSAYRSSDHLRVAWARSDGLVGAPREVDPPVGSPPDVFAVDDRARLLVEDGAADLPDLPGAEVLHELQGESGIGHVVDDEHALP